MAPMDSRVASSFDRAAARASRRLATFTQAMSSTSAVTARSSVSGARASLAKLLCPRDPGSRRMPLALNCAIKASLMPSWSGTSTSLMMARYGVSIAVRACSTVTPRLQTSEQVNPISASILWGLPRSGREAPAHRDRHEDVRIQSDGRSVEPLRRNADDGHGVSVDDYRLADDIRRPPRWFCQYA